MRSRGVTLKDMYFGSVNTVLLNESVVSFNMDEKYVFENILFSDFIMMMSWCDMLFYIHTNTYIIRWLYGMMKPQGGYMLIHVYIYICVYNGFMMMNCHEDTVMIT